MLLFFLSFLIFVVLFLLFFCLARVCACVFDVYVFFFFFGWLSFSGKLAVVVL